VAAGLISFLAALLWISVLRRQVGQKTQELQRTNESLQKLSNQDGLTGIANRRQFDVKLTAEANRVRRPVTHLSLLMVDIDCFKALNDEYGHLHGDECLVRVAKTMNLAIHRAEDLVARYGGEEFAVILPGTGHTGAMEVAERIRAAVQELAIPHNGSPYGHVLTVSVGVATAESADEKTYSKLVELADRALYRSKVLGRNRVTSSEEVEEMSAGEMQPLDGHGRMGI
jgi:two-component system chemotaxis family response regulator WspR